MKVDLEKCIGCKKCVPFCPQGAIHVEDKKAFIDQEECVECGICVRQIECPRKAFYEPEEVRQWPRSVRKVFGDPTEKHESTGVRGRGTEEVKTNDVTGRVCRGELGLCLEMGRPVVGTSVREIEKATMRLAQCGIEIEPCNPLSDLLEDRKTGKFKEEYLEERFVSAIIEFCIPFERGAEMLKVCQEIADRTETVFSMDMICCYNEDGTNPAVKLCEELGVTVRPNAKVNIGIGRPYKIERERC